MRFLLIVSGLCVGGYSTWYLLTFVHYYLDGIGNTFSGLIAGPLLVYFSWHLLGLAFSFNKITVISIKSTLPADRLGGGLIGIFLSLTFSGTHLHYNESFVPYLAEFTVSSHRSLCYTHCIEEIGATFSNGHRAHIPRHYVEKTHFGSHNTIGIHWVPIIGFDYGLEPPLYNAQASNILVILAWLTAILGACRLDVPRRLYRALLYQMETETYVSSFD